MGRLQVSFKVSKQPMNDLELGVTMVTITCWANVPGRSRFRSTDTGHKSTILTLRLGYFCFLTVVSKLFWQKYPNSATPVKAGNELLNSTQENQRHLDLWQGTAFCFAIMSSLFWKFKIFLTNMKWLNKVTSVLTVDLYIAATCLQRPFYYVS